MRGGGGEPGEGRKKTARFGQPDPFRHSAQARRELEAARRHQQGLDRRIAAEERQAAEELAAHQEAARQEARRQREQAAADAEARRSQWTRGQARALVRQGYSPQRASQVTGWPVEDLEGADQIFEYHDRPGGRLSS